LSAAVEVEGTLCRASRRGDRLIVRAGGKRVLVVVPARARVSHEGRESEAWDLRPGEDVTVIGERDGSGPVTALRVEAAASTTDAIAGALLGSKPKLVGRFSVQEAKTEFFSLNVPGSDYVRVDARSAYGPKGRVYVSTLRSGDLLEVSGTMSKNNREIKASSIRVLTDEELDSCRREARQGESPEKTAARETAEQRFLDGHDD
jgi:hypothetical protein